MITLATLHFWDLSNEILIQILHNCKYNVILRFAATSKRHYNIVANSTSLRLHIELEANGLDILERSRTGNTNHSQTLDGLLRYRDAWLFLQLERPVERIIRVEPSIWEHREGNYVVAFSSQPDLFTDPDWLQVIPLGSLNDPAPVTLHHTFREFTLDFEQDLVATVRDAPNGNIQRLAISLCSISTGLPHPLASKSTYFILIDFPVPLPGNEAFTLEIMGDLLAVKIADISDERYEILVWDWKHGALLLRTGSRFYMSVENFTLLDQNHLAVLSIEPDKGELRLIEILIYSIPKCLSAHISSDNHFYLSRCACACPILRFQFPQLEIDYEISEQAFIRSDPIPGRAMHSNSAELTQYVAQTLSISLTLRPVGSSDVFEDPRSVHLRIFIRVEDLLHFLNEYEEQDKAGVIAWDLWGTRASRWFLCDKQTDYWLHWTCGSRFINVNDSHSGHHDLSVFDFNPRTAMRHPPRDSDINISIRSTPQYVQKVESMVQDGSGLHLPREIAELFRDSPPSLIIDTVDSNKPTIISRGFRAPVESRLPFRFVTRPCFLPRCEDWSIDGDYILGINPLNAETERLLVYRVRG